MDSGATFERAIYERMRTQAYHTNWSAVCASSYVPPNVNIVAMVSMLLPPPGQFRRSRRRFSTFGPFEPLLRILALCDFGSTLAELQEDRRVVGEICLYIVTHRHDMPPLQMWYHFVNTYEKVKAVSNESGPSLYSKMVAGTVQNSLSVMKRLEKSHHGVYVDAFGRLTTDSHLGRLTTDSQQRKRVAKKKAAKAAKAAKNAIKGRHSIVIQDTPIEVFLRGGYRLLHAQLGPAFTPPEIAMAFARMDPLHRMYAGSSQWIANRVDNAQQEEEESPVFFADLSKGYAQGFEGDTEGKTFCGSLWKPGWGLHSASRVVEVRLKEGARIVVFTHDVYSERIHTGKERDKEERVGEWNSRCINRSGTFISKFARCVTTPQQLGVYQKALPKRRTTYAGGGCRDPITEVWFEWDDVAAMRAVCVNTQNAHDTNLKVRTISGWVRVGHKPHCPEGALKDRMKEDPQGWEGE